MLASGVIAHYTAIMDAVNIPCVLYNVPSRTGVNVKPETLYKLCKHRNCAAMKEASGNISQVAEMARLCNDYIDLYSGNDDQIVPLMSLGGKGVISVLANIAPKARTILPLYILRETLKRRVSCSFITSL